MAGRSTGRVLGEIRCPSQEVVHAQASLRDRIEPPTMRAASPHPCASREARFPRSRFCDGVPRLPGRGRGDRVSGDPAERRHRAVRRLARMRMARLTRAGDATALRAFHARAKYLLMACDPQRARALGALAAGARNGGGNAFAEYAAVLDAVLAWPPPRAATRTRCCTCTATCRTGWTRRRGAASAGPSPGIAPAPAAWSGRCACCGVDRGVRGLLPEAADVLRGVPQPVSGSWRRQGESAAAWRVFPRIGIL